MRAGVTGYVVDSVEEAVKALGRIGGLDRGVCRSVFEKRFTSRRMAEDYVSAYRSFLGAGVKLPARAGVRSRVRLSRSSC